MALSRRAFTQGALALPLISAAPRFASAQMTIGAGTLTTVSDGTLTLPGDFIFAPMPQDELAEVLAAYDQPRDALTPQCNLALFRDGENTVLFDVGAGPDFMPTAGQTLASLETLGIAPDDVTHVVFTHAHPDHIWGLLDEFDEPAFWNATYMMGRAEWDYWWNPETVNTIGEARAAFAVGAKRRMEAIEDQVELVDDDQTILPGITAISSAGHTPGHMSFEIRDGTAGALILGDAIGNHHVALARPDWESGSDQDPATAAATRRALLDRIRSQDLAVVGFHLPSGGMGYIDTHAEGYRFVAKDTI